MILKDYIPNINKKISEVYFSGIAFDSSKVKKDNIFFAIKGNKIDGNNFILSAIKNGAKIIVTEKKKYGLKNGILFIQVMDNFRFKKIHLLLIPPLTGLVRLYYI